MQPLVVQKTITTKDPSTVCEVLSILSGLSKLRIKRAMTRGAAWLKHAGRKMQRIRRATAPVRPGDVIALYYDESILARQPPQSRCIKDFKQYSIWYKPAGLMTQGTRFGDHCALSRQVEQHYQSQHRGRQVLLVHRIDREAAGLVLVSHNRIAAARFSKMFRKRQIEKHYRIKVRGDLCSVGAEGTIDLALNNRPAQTLYRPLSYDPSTDQSLVRVQIITGRRHQIRRHFEMIGHPVMGDPLYGSNNKNETGLELTAISLTFECPFGNGQINTRIDPDVIKL